MFIGHIPSSTCSRVDAGVHRISRLLSVLDECVNDLGEYYKRSFSQPKLNTQAVSSLTVLVFSIPATTDHYLF
jgi:hypothetical protein